MNKRIFLTALTGISAAVFCIAAILHVLGFFTYWDSRWHLWLYVPIALLLLAVPVWKICFRAKRGSFREHCPKWLLAVLVLLLCYLLIMWFLNIFVSQEGIGYLDGNGFAFADENLEFPISADEYHTLHRVAYQMTTEPLLTLSSLPALFFFVRFRAERDA